MTASVSTILSTLSGDNTVRLLTVYYFVYLLTYEFAFTHDIGEMYTLMTLVKFSAQILSFLYSIIIL